MNANSQSLSIAPPHITLSLPQLKCTFYFLWAAPISDVTFISCRCHSSSSMSLSVRLSIKPLGTSCTLLSVQCHYSSHSHSDWSVTVRHSFAYPSRTSLSLLHMSFVYVKQLPIPPPNLQVLPHVIPTYCHSHTVPLTYLLTLTCSIAPISKVAGLYVSLAYHKCHSYRFCHSHTETYQSCILSFPI